jgi:hypothetical protein
MKLYTEEQVIEFTMAMISQYEFGNKNIHNRELLKESLDNKKPIELPSDDWIMEYSDRVFEQDDNVGKLIWSEGAKFMIREISNRLI